MAYGRPIRRRPGSVVVLVVVVLDDDGPISMITEVGVVDVDVALVDVVGGDDDSAGALVLSVVEFGALGT